MNPYRIRRAVLADVPTLVALLVDDPLGATRESTADLTPYETAFAAVDADPNQLLVCLTAGDEVVGTLQLTVIRGLSRRGTPRGQIEAVHVRRDHRGRGAGRTLMAWVIEEARRRGCGLVQLTTDRSRHDAHRFYARLGFVDSHHGLKLPL